MFIYVAMYIDIGDIMDDKFVCSICEKEVPPENVVVRYAEIICSDCAKDIVLPIRRESPRVGRNEKCPCGSTRKFKNCCGRST